eukprot:9500095-Pyramimonas_sp.AAC.1
MHYFARGGWVHASILRSIVPASEVHNGCFYSPAVPVLAKSARGGMLRGGVGAGAEEDGF